MSNRLAQKIELEATLINTMLDYSESFNEVIKLISTEEIFDRPEHRTIIRDAMKYFTEKGKAPCIADIYEMQLLSKEDRNNIKDYLTKTISKSGTEIREIQSLAKKLIDMKIEMELKEFQRKCPEAGLDYLNANSQKSLELTNKYLGGMMTVKTNLEVAEEVMTRIMNGAGNNFIKTGFERIDKYTNGIPKSHLTIIAGRPGTGKTTFMLHLLRNLLKQNLKVGIFSLEMTAESLFIKNISAVTGIDSLRIESSDLTKEEKGRLFEASKDFSLDNYSVIDLSIQTPSTIKTQINLWKLRNQVDIVLLDYLTLVATDYKQARYDLEIGRLSGELNSLAKTTGIPIVILSQLNRMSESRQDRRPQLSDLKESGSIEQDASMVLLLYRPGLYNINVIQGSDYSYTTLEGSPLDKDEYYEVIIAKARSGRTGNACLRYRPEIHNFEPVIVEKKIGEKLSGEYSGHLKAWESGKFRGN